MKHVREAQTRAERGHQNSKFVVALSALVLGLAAVVLQASNALP
jgi:hypothetical protein